MIKKILTSVLLVLVAANVVFAKVGFDPANLNRSIAIYSDDIVEEIEEVKSYKDCLAKAQKGDAFAMAKVAYMLVEGDGTAKNYKEAFEWAKKASDLGESNGINILGYMYDKGYGVSRDTKKAQQLYMKAAELGNPGAMNNIAVGYAEKSNIDEAYKWLIRAVNLNCDTASYNIGYFQRSAIMLPPKANYNEEFDRKLAKTLRERSKRKMQARMNAFENAEMSTVPQAAKQTYSIFDTVGFDVSDKVRSSDGYLVISKVKSGDMAEKLGMLTGSDLYQVDNMNMKQCNASELKSYIKKQAESKATVLVIFMGEDGAPKKIDITLK